MGVPRTRQRAHLMQDPALRNRFGTGTMTLRVGTTQTHAHTHAHIHKLILLFLTHFTNKNSVLQVALGPTQICTHHCFFFCAATKQVPRLATSNLFPRICAFHADAKSSIYTVRQPSFQVNDKCCLTNISSNRALQKICAKCPQFARLGANHMAVWCSTVPYDIIWNTYDTHTIYTPNRMAIPNGHTNAPMSALDIVHWKPSVQLKIENAWSADKRR